MFMGARTPVYKGQQHEQWWLKHTIELWRVELTPPSGHSIGTVRHRQTAV